MHRFLVVLVMAALDLPWTSGLWVWSINSSKVSEFRWRSNLRPLSCFLPHHPTAFYLVHPFSCELLFITFIPPAANCWRFIIFIPQAVTQSCSGSLALSARCRPVGAWWSRTLGRVAGWILCRCCWLVLSSLQSAHCWHRQSRCFHRPGSERDRERERERKKNAREILCHGWCTRNSKYNRRFRKRWRRPQILQFCGDSPLIRRESGLIRTCILLIRRSSLQNCKIWSRHHLLRNRLLTVPCLTSVHTQNSSHRCWSSLVVTTLNATTH